VKKMKIGYFVKTQDACWWMRVATPMSHLTLRGHEVKECLVDQVIQCIHCGKPEIQEIHMGINKDVYHCKWCFAPIMNQLDVWKQSIFEQLDWCEVAVFQRILDISHLNLMKEAKARGKLVICESDDNYLDIPEKNPGYAAYKDQREVIEEIFRTADGHTVTTQGLKDAYLPYNKNIQVIPNSYDIELYDSTPEAPSLRVFTGKGRPTTWENFQEQRKGKKFVCWAGSPTHEDDVAMMIKPLKKLIEREDVVVGMVCYIHAMMIKHLPEDKLFLFSLVPVMYWFNLLQAMKPDVWLGPVVHNKFNAGKSNVKKLEAAMMGSVFVGSDFDTYNQDGFQSVLVENTEYEWWRGLRQAVNMEPEEKEGIVKHNREILLRDFDIKRVVDQWERFFSTGVAE